MSYDQWKTTEPFDPYGEELEDYIRNRPRHVPPQESFKALLLARAASAQWAGDTAGAEFYLRAAKAIRT